MYTCNRTAPFVQHGNIPPRIVIDVERISSTIFFLKNSLMVSRSETGLFLRMVVGTECVSQAERTNRNGPGSTVGLPYPRDPYPWSHLYTV